MRQVLNFRLFFFTILGLPFFRLHAQPTGTVINLQTEYLKNPVGLDVASPRFTWQLNNASPRARQSAFQVCVGTDPVAVSKGIGNTWQPALQNSDVQLLHYNGRALQAFTKYYWSIRVWDKNNTMSQWTNPASFEMGMMNTHNWKGAWITDMFSIDGQFM